MLRRSWRRIALALLLLAVAGAPILLVPHGVGSFGYGIWVGGWVVFAAEQTVHSSNSAGRIMGASAEQWTSGELRRLRRHGWRLVNGVQLRVRDIDHVLIGPGGAFAVESKWTARPWTLDPPEDRVIAAAVQAADNARDLRLWSGFRPARAVGCQPVVVLWGPIAGEPRSFVEPSTGALVMPGQDLGTWCGRLADSAERLPADSVVQCWDALAEQARMRDAHDTPATTPTALLRRAGAFAAAFLGAALLVAQLGVWLNSLAAWAALTLAAAVAGLMGRRAAICRWAANGWLAGVALLCIVAAVAVARAAWGP